MCNIQYTRLDQSCNLIGPLMNFQLYYLYSLNSVSLGAAVAVTAVVEAVILTAIFSMIVMCVYVHAKKGSEGEFIMQVLLLSLYREVYVTVLNL